MTANPCLPVAAIVLVICLLISAGCTSIPGPDVRFTPLPTETTQPVVPQVKTSPIKIGQHLAANATVTTAPSATAQAGSTSAAYESRTCSALGGSPARPGEKCPGEWLNAADTFSCCSKEPFREASSRSNTTVTIDPFVLVVDTDDDPGSVLP